MNEHRIRLGNTDSVKSSNSNNLVNVDVTQTTKLLPQLDIVETINQRTLFNEERSKSTKYRLIVTISSYCSNVLFNTMTEIVKDEGSSDVMVIHDEVNPQNIYSAIGNQTPTRIDMIANTEYSRDDIGYNYLPGYDIFNNHILRNKSFKVINKIPDNSTDDSRNVFNTLGDTMRNFTGDVPKLRKRTDRDTNSVVNERHLYLVDDVMSYEESINTNLREDNGWFGFVNKANIDVHGIDSNDWSQLVGVNMVLNNRKSCEFVDMYPGRDLYSFNPKYNSYRQRPEYNWNLCITYPYRHVKKGYSLIYGGGINAISVITVSYETSYFSNNVMVFRCLINHGLTSGDYVYVYFSLDSGTSYKRSPNPYRVDGIGDMRGNNKEYYFYISDTNLLYDIAEFRGDDFSGFSLNADDKNCNKTVSELLDSITYRFARSVNGIPCEYYIRLFKKLPNVKFKNDDTKKYVDLDREQYKLAFASTIYNDNLTQVTFTDSLEVDGLTDNLDRPLTELYLTIVKNNAGYKEWYRVEDNTDENAYKNENVEFSHCFGNVSCGVDMHIEIGDVSDLKNASAVLGNIHLLNELGCFNSSPINYYDVIKECNIGSSVSIGDNVFLGDIVEFAPLEMRERKLVDIEHRFNTAQRELKVDNGVFDKFQYDEIEQDDYDNDGFVINHYSNIGKNNNVAQFQHKIGEKELQTYQRPEGYHYKPHYKIPIKEFGMMQQSSHFDIKVVSAQPVQKDGVYIQLNCGLKSDVSVGDEILVCDDAKGVEYKTTVAYVFNKYQFLVNPIMKKEMSWIKFCDIMNSDSDSKRFKIRRVNREIPSYAYKIGNNKFVWRGVQSIGNDRNVSLEEYPFANGHFYINKEINFFVKRQDPHGIFGLRSDNIFPNDISGNVKTESNYTYKEEDSYTTC